MHDIICTAQINNIIYDTIWVLGIAVGKEVVYQKELLSRVAFHLLLNINTFHYIIKYLSTPTTTSTNQTPKNQILNKVVTYIICLCLSKDWVPFFELVMFNSISESWELRSQHSVARYQESAGLSYYVMSNSPIHTTSSIPFYIAAWGSGGELKWQISRRISCEHKRLRFTTMWSSENLMAGLKREVEELKVFKTELRILEAKMEATTNSYLPLHQNISNLMRQLIKDVRRNTWLGIVLKMLKRG